MHWSLCCPSHPSGRPVLGLVSLVKNVLYFSDASDLGD